MSWTKRRIVLMTALGLAAIAVPAYALFPLHWAYPAARTAFTAATGQVQAPVFWIHPCETKDDLTCDEIIGQTFNCRCEADFEDDANWFPGAPGPSSFAEIEHSNASVTDEEWLELLFTTQSIAQFTLITEDTGGDDTLEVRFTPDDGTNGDTLTTGTLTLDATNGKVTLKTTGLAIVTN